MSSAIRRNLQGPYPAGVPSPLTVHVHPYPTRYHGTINTRPVFTLPYVESPHAVFKPDDFYSFYPGVNGLGALGAVQPIYYLAAKENPRVSSLQQALNVALVSGGMLPISVTGKLDAKTCGALIWATSVTGADADEARRTCALAQRGGAKPIAPTPNPAAIVTTTAPPTNNVVTPAVVENIPTTATPTPTVITADSTVTPVGPSTPPVETGPVLPEQEPQSQPGYQKASMSPLMIGLVVLGVAGLAYYATRKH